MNSGDLGSMALMVALFGTRNSSESFKSGFRDVSSLEFSGFTSIDTFSSIVWFNACCSLHFYSVFSCLRIVSSTDFYYFESSTMTNGFVIVFSSQINVFGGSDDLLFTGLTIVQLFSSDFWLNSGLSTIISPSLSSTSSKANCTVFLLLLDLSEPLKTEFARLLLGSLIIVVFSLILRELLGGFKLAAC